MTENAIDQLWETDSESDGQILTDNSFGFTVRIGREVTDELFAHESDSDSDSDSFSDIDYSDNISHIGISPYLEELLSSEEENESGSENDSQNHIGLIISAELV